MAVVDVLNIDGEKVSTVELSDGIFNVPVKSEIMHEVVRMQLAVRRSGTANVKHRSDVKGSTRKLFRQKGTGRARRGDIKSPLLRGGGVVFGPNQRSHGFQVPKKVRKLALRMALSAKLKENGVVILDGFELEETRTKKFLAVMTKLNLGGALIVTDRKNENLELSSRNVADVKVLRQEGLNVYDILKYPNLILLESSIKGIEGRLNA